MSRFGFGVELPDDPRVREYMRRVNKRLRSRSGVMIYGQSRSLGGGLYAVGVETAVGFTAFIIGPLMMLFSGVASWVLFHSVFWSNLLVGLGLAGLVFVSVLVSPWFHRMVMGYRVWRLTGRWVNKPMSGEVLWRLSRGKV